jgi:hypothetical protein
MVVQRPSYALRYALIHVIQNPKQVQPTLVNYQIHRPDLHICSIYHYLLNSCVKVRYRVTLIVRQLYTIGVYQRPNLNLTGSLVAQSLLSLTSRYLCALVRIR